MAGNGKQEKKDSKAVIFECMVEWMKGDPLYKNMTTLPKVPWPSELYKKLKADDGSPQTFMWKDIGENVLVPHSLEATIDDVARFADRNKCIDLKRFDSVALKKLVTTWWHSVEDFTGEISPILQKSTKGYCYHRLDFDIADEPTPAFDSFCSRISTNKDAFLSFVGSFFEKKAPTGYCWLYGEGDDGKSAFFRFISKLFKHTTVSLSADYQQMSGRFYTAGLVGKRLAIIDETGTYTGFVKHPVFKSITGDAPINVEFKGKNSYMHNLNTQIMVGSNASAPAVGSGRADIRRAIICEIQPRSLPEHEIKDYEEILWNERKGIIYKCWKAWQENKKTTKYYIICDRQVAMDAAQENESDYETIFNKYFELDLNSKLSNDRMYPVLKMEFDNNDNKVSNFKLWLKSNKKIKFKQDWNDKKRYWHGLSEKKSDI